MGSSSFNALYISCFARSYVRKCSSLIWSLPVENQQIQEIMTKAEIANEIAKTTGIDKAAVVTVIEQLMTVVKDSLAHGENVYLRGFGSFVVKQRAEKTARNISKNTTIVIPAHNIPAFKPANCFKEEVAK